MDAFGPIKGAVGTAALVGSIGSLAAEKGKENKLTEKQQELDKREEIAGLKQASVNTEGEILKLRETSKAKFDEKQGFNKGELKELAGYKKSDNYIEGATSIDKIRGSYIDTRSGKSMSEKKAQAIQNLRFSKVRADKAMENLREQIRVKRELNLVREERLAMLEGREPRTPEWKAKREEHKKRYQEYIAKRYGKKEGVKTNE